MTKDKKIMFLCDRLKDCRNSFSCGLDCRHTEDPEHAKYPVHNNFIRDAHDPNLWWECETYE